MKRAPVAVAIAIVLVGAVAWIFVLTHHHDPILVQQVNDEEAVQREHDDSPRVVVDQRTDASIVLDKAKRDDMREKIYRAWGMPVPKERSDPSTWPSPPRGARDDGFGADYVQERIRADFIPLAKDCYEQGLKKNPTLAGRLVADFRIVGSKNTGGLIDWVDTTNEETTLDDKDVVECLTQSLYSVTFEAPPNDGTITVRYPLRFSPDQPDE